MRPHTGWLAGSLIPILGAVTVFSSPPASAATLSFHDPRGDAPARFDLTRVTVTNGDDLSVKSRIRNLKGGITQIYVINLMAVGSSDSYYAKTVWRADGTVTGKLYEGITPVNCEVNGQWRPERDDVRISFSRDCLTEPGRVRLNAAIGAGNGNSGDPADWTKTVGVSMD